MGGARAIPLAVLLAWPLPAGAQWKSRLELMGTGDAFAQREPLPSPEAALPDWRVQGEVRGDVSVEKGRLSLALKPRFRAETVEGPEGRRDHAEAFIGQALVRLRLTNAFSLSAGREIATWGPAILRSPSNPFYPDNGRANPARELPGIDVVRASYAPSLRWNATLLGHVREGRFVSAGETFRRSLTLKVDVNGTSHSASFNVMKAEGEGLRGGAYGQINVADAFLFYAEAGAGPRPAEPAKAFVTVLAGGSYTFSSGASLALELLRNGEDRPAAGTGPAAAAAGALLLGRQTGRPLLGRHYVLVQVQNNPAQGRRIWQGRYTQNVDDGSGQASGYFEWTLFSRVAPFALVSVARGALRSEFGAQRDRMVMAGARIFVW